MDNTLKNDLSSKENKSDNQKDQMELQALRTQVDELQSKLKNVTHILSSVMTAPQLVTVLQSTSNLDFELPIKLDKEYTNYCNLTNRPMSTFMTSQRDQLETFIFQINLTKPLHISNLTVINPNGNSAYATMTFNGSSELTIENCTFNGVGLYISVNSKVILNDVNFLNTGATGLQLSNCTDSTMTKVNISHCKGNGCYINQCKSVQISGIKISGCNGIGLYVVSSQFTVKDWSIDSCDQGISLANNSVGTYDKEGKITRIRGDEVCVNSDSSWLQFE
eukprot:TRINITY_DN4736_c0_g1_i3.p1 TRINITY_DN4736_c0_g1~~TRINITY_DN4736_c0_g1_i3.p1  ORF type:complete len:278 (-),score=4.00 TRINITY_DN4736_c0_g1_i3:237-1070(-)